MMKRILSLSLTFCALAMLLPASSDAGKRVIRKYQDPQGRFWVNYQSHWAIAKILPDYVNFYFKGAKSHYRAEVSVEFYGPVNDTWSFAQELVRTALDPSQVIERPRSVWFNGQQCHTILFRASGHSGLIRSWFLNVHGNGYIVQAAATKKMGDPGKNKAIRAFNKGIHIGNYSVGPRSWTEVRQYDLHWNAPWRGRYGNPSQAPGYGSSAPPSDSPWRTGQGNTTDGSYYPGVPGQQFPVQQDYRSLTGVWQLKRGTVNGHSASKLQLAAVGNLTIFANGTYRWNKYQGNYQLLSGGSLRLDGMPGCGFVQDDQLNWSSRWEGTAYTYVLWRCDACPMPSH